MTEKAWPDLANDGWGDLADNLPGEALRRHADRLHAEWRGKPLLARAFTPRTAERNWRRAAEAEEVLALKLSALDARWRVLHSVAVGRRAGDIDHLVIGPGGVFTMSARSHLGRKAWVSGDILMVNGFRQPAVRDSRYKAARASAALSAAVGFDVPVVGVVVLVGTVKETVKEQPRDGQVVVTTASDARRLLQRQPERWSDRAVEQVYDAARRPQTWTAATSAARR